jgi:hypothetical protein
MLQSLAREDEFVKAAAVSQITPPKHMIRHKMPAIAIFNLAMLAGTFASSISLRADELSSAPVKGFNHETRLIAGKIESGPDSLYGKPTGERRVTQAASLQNLIGRSLRT